MRVGVAYVDVRVNMIKYKKDLRTLESLAATATTKVNANLGRIGAGQTRLGQSSAAAATGMDKVTKASKKQSKSLLGMIPHVAAVTISYMAMRTAWRAVLSGLGAGVEFQQKMAVVKAVSRATADEFVALESAARKMALGTIFTATQTADALKFLSMAGFEVKESIAALPGVLNLALIGELELGRATDIASDTLRAFGMEADELGRVTDVMVATITRSNTNIEMMGQAMKFAAPVAKALGYEIEEVSAMIGTLSQSGIKAGIAGRTLQQSFIRTQKAARGLGLEIGSRLIDVLKEYKRIQEETEKVYGRTAAAEKLAARVKKDYGLIALKSILILKENIAGYEKLANAAYLSAGETERAAYIMQDTVSAQYKILKSIIADISVSIFDEYKGGLKDLLYDTGQWFTENKEELQTWANAVIATFEGITYVIGLVIRGWKELYSLVPPTGQGWLSAMNPVENIAFFSDLEKIKELGGEDKLAEIAASIGDEGGGVVSVQFPKFRKAAHELAITLNNVARAQKKVAEMHDLETTAAGRVYLATVKVKEGYEDFYTGLDDWKSAVHKQALDTYAALPENAKKAFEAAKKIREYEEKIREDFQGMIEQGMFGPDAKAAAEDAEAAIKAMLRIYKKADKDIEKAEKAHLKFREKTIDIETKVEGDKYDVMVNKATRHFEKLSAMYESFNAEQKANWAKLGMDREGLQKDFNTRYNAIEAKRIKDRDKLDDAARAKAERDAAKALRQKASDAKALVDIQRDLLDEMTRNDEGYFALLAIIRQQEFGILRDKYKGKDREKYDDILKDVEIAVGKKDARERALKTDDVFAGMGVGWAEYMDGLQTWADQGKAIFEEFASASKTAISDTLFRAIKGDLDSFTDIWYAFLETMLKAFTDSMAQMLQQWIMDDMVKSLGGGLKGFAGFLSSFFTGSISGTAGGAPSSGTGWAGGTIAHSGGTIGVDAMPMRLVPSDIFKGARRLHEGLMPDEFPAILQRGETVFPKGDNVFQRTSSEGIRTPKGGDGASAGDGLQSGGDKYDVNIHAVDARSFADLMERNPGAVLTTINRALEKNPTGRHKLKRMVS